MAKKSKCTNCGKKTAARSGLCRLCQQQIEEMHEEQTERELSTSLGRAGILVAMEGSVWWAWDRIGRVLAGPHKSRWEILEDLLDEDLEKASRGEEP